MARVDVAIAHDDLTQRGGAERVVLSLHRAFPEAPIYTLLYNPDTTFPEFKNAQIITSPLNRSQFLRGHNRAGLPFYARASDRLVVDARVTVASSTRFAHTFAMTGRRLIYCHSPARFLYSTDEYLGRSAWTTLPGIAVNLLKPRLIARDQAAAAAADGYLANSHAVAQRIRECYGRDAEVLHPPVTLDVGGPRDEVAALTPWAAEGYLLLVSRLLPYKNVDVAIEAVRGTDERLVIVGAGPEADRLSRLAPDNVRLVSDLTDAQVRWLYANATALIAPSLEDFGLTPIEAASYGVPTVALRARGYLDTIVEGTTGVFFDRPEPAAIRAALSELRATTWSSSAISAHAANFSETRFISRMNDKVAELLAQPPS